MHAIEYTAAATKNDPLTTIKTSGIAHNKIPCMAFLLSRQSILFKIPAKAITNNIGDILTMSRLIPPITNQRLPFIRGPARLVRTNINIVPM